MFNRGVYLYTPLTFLLMPLDPFVGGSIVSGAAGVLGNVLGGIFGSKSQSSANKTNLQINRENNAFNAEQAQINRDWTESLWNKSNSYNSAVSQRQRLEQAGLNPYLMMNGGNAGVATAQSGTAASAAQSAHMEAYDPTNAFNGASNAISNAINSYYANIERSNSAQQMAAQSSLMEEQAKNWRIRNIYEGLRQQYEINKLSHDSNNSFETYMLTKAKRKLAWETFGSDVQYKQNQVNIQNQQMELNSMSIIEKNLNNSMLQVQLNYLPQQMRAQINATLADAAYKYALGQLTRQQAQTEVYRGFTEMWNSRKSMFSANLTQLDYLKTKKTLDKTIESTLNELENNKTFNTAPGLGGEISRGYTRFVNTLLSPLGKLLGPAATVLTKK